MYPEICATLAILAVLAYWLARRPLAQGRLRAAGVSPPATRACQGVDAARERILALGGDDSPITAVAEKDGIITVAWQLNGVPWATQQFQQRLRTTWAVDLSIGDGVVFARIRRGDVSWVSPAATWMPRAEVKWSTPLRPPIPPGDGETVPGQVGATTPRTAELIVETVRHCVVQTGHRFEHVLLFPT